MTVSVAIVGAFGRMGTLATTLLENTEGFSVAARIGSSDDLAPIAGADVVLDVTNPETSARVVEAAIEARVPIVVGTSGWSEARIQRVRDAVAARPGARVLIVPNFAVGSVLASRLAAWASRWLERVEIVEIHRSKKPDAPSGTAIRTAEMIAAARGAAGQEDGPDHPESSSNGTLVAGIPVHSLRLDGVGARQVVTFGGRGESLQIVHDAASDEAYADGILRAILAVREQSGVVVGLDAALGLDLLGTDVFGTASDSDDEARR